MLDVEVFPVEVNRWVAVIKNPAGEFSTEAPSAEEIPAAVRSALSEVLGAHAPEHRFVDQHGRPWDGAVAEEQAAALDR